MMLTFFYAAGTAALLELAADYAGHRAATSMTPRGATSQTVTGC